LREAFQQEQEISRERFLEICSNSVDITEANTLFDQLDVDKDGKISLEEVIHLFPSEPETSSETLIQQPQSPSFALARQPSVGPSPRIFVRQPSFGTTPNRSRLSLRNQWGSMNMNDQIKLLKREPVPLSPYSASKLELQTELCSHLVKNNTQEMRDLEKRNDELSKEKQQLILASTKKQREIEEIAEKVLGLMLI